MPNVFITGAAGNLGSLLARHLLTAVPGTHLLLMQHSKPVPADVAAHPRAEVRIGDLSDRGTLEKCLNGADVIVHFAGVLFKADPAQFLPITNLRYFQNLVDTANALGIGKIILTAVFSRLLLLRMELPPPPKAAPGPDLPGRPPLRINVQKVRPAQSVDRGFHRHRPGHLLRRHKAIQRRTAAGVDP